MRLTSFTDFALRALMRLAGEPARSFATNEIAAEFKISRNHLAKVVRALEGEHALAECFRSDGGACVLTPRCRLKARLAAAREAFMRELDATTLAECAYPASLKTSSRTRPRKNS